MTNKAKISEFFLNYLALEGAQGHFQETLPEDNQEINHLFKNIEKLGFPQRWSKANQAYETATIEGNTNCKKCWSCLEVIRNNLFHATKAFKPDPHERLESLLDWSLSYMNELMKDKHAIGIRAREIQKVLNII